MVSITPRLTFYRIPQSSASQGAEAPDATTEPSLPPAAAASCVCVAPYARHAHVWSGGVWSCLGVPRPARSHRR